MSGLKDDAPSSAGAPEWVLTYGDTMSLLLTFFIMLAALSEVKKKDEFEVLAEALRNRFGRNVTVDMVDMLVISAKPTAPTPLKSVSQGREKLSKALQGASNVRGLQGSELSRQSVRPGDQVTIGGVVFFQEGTDQPEVAFEEKLKQIAALLAGKPQMIEMRGHTSPRPLPPNSPYASHWDLAFAECMRVREGLVALGIEPQRIRISVAAANELLYTDPDPEKRKLNARVEISLLNELSRGFEEVTHHRDRSR